MFAIKKMTSFDMQTPFNTNSYRKETRYLGKLFGSNYSITVPPHIKALRSIDALELYLKFVLKIIYLIVLFHMLIVSFHFEIYFETLHG